MSFRARLTRPAGTRGEPGIEDEVAVLGLARSGRAVAELLVRNGCRVYASDVAISAEVLESAKELDKLGVFVQTGGHDLPKIASAAFVVLSPGIPPNAPAVRVARDLSRLIVSEVEIALAFLQKSRVIAVTGTNGKTTTTALIAHMLRALGADAVPAGNIGTPLSTIALRPHHPDWIALEMSSFQLHDTPNLKPAVGVLTNLGPDHLDRYPSVEEYFADKARLFANAEDMSKWVVNADDHRALKMSDGVPGKRYLFSISSKADACYDTASLTLKVFGKELLPRAELSLMGSHNVANALAASLAVMVADPAFAKTDARRTIAEALRTFHALPHRLELVAEIKGVRWVNDSKATNVGSTKVAIEGMERPTILLLGGRHKGESYASLGDAIAKDVKLVIAFGEAAPLIASDLSGIAQVEQLGSDFEEVVAAARKAASAGDTVLLSPACSSYDMFVNYEERGETFRRLVKELG